MTNFLFSIQEKVNQTLRRMTNLLQIYIISQFGCGIKTSQIPRDMPENKKNKEFRYGNHHLLIWFDWFEKNWKKKHWKKKVKLKKKIKKSNLNDWI